MWNELDLKVWTDIIKYIQISAWQRQLGSREVPQLYLLFMFTTRNYKRVKYSAKNLSYGCKSSHHCDVRITVGLYSMQIYRIEIDGSRDTSNDMGICDEQHRREHVEKTGFRLIQMCVFMVANLAYMEAEPSHKSWKASTLHMHSTNVNTQKIMNEKCINAHINFLFDRYDVSLLVIM